MNNLSPRVQVRDPAALGPRSHASCHTSRALSLHRARSSLRFTNGRTPSCICHRRGKSDSYSLRFSRFVYLFQSTVGHSLSLGSRPKRPARMVSRRSRSAPIVFRRTRVQTSYSRTSWPRRRWPTLSARPLDPEVAPIVVEENRASSLYFRS